MKVTQIQEKLLIEVEPEGHDSKVMRSGKAGFFGRKELVFNGQLYQMQVLGYVKTPKTGHEVPEEQRGNGQGADSPHNAGHEAGAE